MSKNISPWITELNRIRPVDYLTTDIKTDIAIIGGGIAGVTTAYYLLKQTDKNVIMLEGGKVAHGATGHNAGQIVSYFEKPFSEIVSKYGIEKAIEAQNDILSTWNLLENIYKETNIQTPVYYFSGYAGYTDTASIIAHIANRDVRNFPQYHINKIYISETATELLKEIPEIYQDLYTVVPQLEILELLETNNTDYIAAFPSRKGCLNSALFTEELVGYLLNTYPERFILKEHCHINKIILENNHASAIHSHHTVESDNIVLCTNGFEKITIINNAGTDINKSFHDTVDGLIGYMAGYNENTNKAPTAVSYYDQKNIATDNPVDTDPYFYLTRRPNTQDESTSSQLVCVGGPEYNIDDKLGYDRDSDFPQKAQDEIDTFIKKNYVHEPQDLKPKYQWHGLMGYTKSGIRLIGPEPRNPVLLYNLGCNGVGILPSIFGSHKIAQFINNEVTESSIFDPV